MDVALCTVFGAVFIWKPKRNPRKPETNFGARDFHTYPTVREKFASTGSPVPGETSLKRPRSKNSPGSLGAGQSDFDPDDDQWNPSKTRHLATE